MKPWVPSSQQEEETGSCWDFKAWRFLFNYFRCGFEFGFLFVDINMMPRPGLQRNISCLVAI